MAVNNKLTPDKKADTTLVTYESNGETIKLSPTMIRKYLVSGGGNVTDEDVMMFLSLCKYQHLNPFLKEAYLIKYGNSDAPATIVTGKDVFTKRARRIKDYAGKQAGIIVLNEQTGEVTEREGTFSLPNEKIVGGWAKVFIKGYEQPEYSSVSFEEYVGKTKDGKVNSQWASKPGVMIRKCALVSALREAFPEDFNGMYAPEEMGAAGDVVLNDDGPSEIVVDAAVMEEPKEAKSEPMNPPVEATEDAVQQTLFGGEE